MKLSDAIMKGCLVTNPVHYTASCSQDEQRMRASDKPLACALEAAAFVTHGIRNASSIDKDYPILWTRAKPPPDLCGLIYQHADGMNFVYDICVRLNDGAKWTREHIAEWVRSIEVAA